MMHVEVAAARAIGGYVLECPSERWRNETQAYAYDAVPLTRTVAIVSDSHANHDQSPLFHNSHAGAIGIDPTEHRYRS
jgi:hypothetical protein